MKFADFLLQEKKDYNDLSSHKKMLKDNFKSYMSYFRGLGMFYYDHSKERVKENDELFNDLWDNLVNHAGARVDKHIEDEKITIKDKSSDEYKGLIKKTLEDLMDIKDKV